MTTHPRSFFNCPGQNRAAGILCFRQLILLRARISLLRARISSLCSKKSYTEQKSAVQRKLRDLAQRWIVARQISINNDVSIIVGAAAFFEKATIFQE